jgi:hypothetical protein
LGSGSDRLFLGVYMVGSLSGSIPIHAQSCEWRMRRSRPHNCTEPSWPLRIVLSIVGTEKPDSRAASWTVQSRSAYGSKPSHSRSMEFRTFFDRLIVRTSTLSRFKARLTVSSLAFRAWHIFLMVQSFIAATILGLGELIPLAPIQLAPGDFLTDSICVAAILNMLGHVVSHSSAFHEVFP